MQKTANYGLNQWELTDRIQMEDFNSDNAKIDAALKAASFGNCHISTGSYTGSGTYGTNNPSTLTFDFVPKFIFIFPSVSSYNSSTLATLQILPQQGVAYCRLGSNLGVMKTVTLNGNTVSWYAGDASDQGNAKTIYYYVVFG